jgi:hypothetical protein
MSGKNPSMPYSSSAGLESFADREEFSANGHAGRKMPDSGETDGNSMFANHRGKLAVGAAAMLGLAVYYKWREHRLAKEDPEEYERFRRIKAVVETDEAEPA